LSSAVAVSVGAHPQAAPVSAALPGIAQLREAGRIRVHEFDTYLPLLSVPHVLGTTLATLPAAVPYLDGAAVRRRKPAGALPLLRPTPHPTVGIVWAGSPTHRQDRHRSCALLEQLDLIISVDTAVVHLAGALGKPVWVLLSYVPDWRWGLAGERTPWYPTMRLFRQTRAGEWGR
jgi:hypothetical protein